jgi:hypothetical protein
MPLEDVMAMYWRVKKWRWSVTAQWAETNSALATWSFEFSTEVHAGQAVAINTDYGNIVEEIRTAEPEDDETSLVCGFPALEVTEINFDVEPPAEQTSFLNEHFRCDLGDFHTATGGEFAGSAGTRGRFDVAWGFSGNVGAGTTVPAAFGRKKPNGYIEYMPSIRFTGSTFSWEIFAYPADRPTTGNNYGTFTYKFLDKTYDCPILAHNTRADLAGFTNTLSIDATLEAIEYWPYDPNDGGGPIYDPESGGQLR